MVTDRKNKERVTSQRQWLIAAVVMLAMALTVVVGGSVYLSQPLVLPDSVTIQPLTLAEQAQMDASEFVQGLEGTDIQVSFAEDIDTEKFGWQEVQLVFRREYRTCTATAQLYRFALIPAVTVPLGEETQVDGRDFVADTNVEAQLLTPLTEDVCGIFDLRLLCAGREYAVKCTVTEDIAPEGEGREVTVEAGAMPDPVEFVGNIVDHTPVTVTYKQEQKFVVAGEHAVTLVLTDLFGNTAEVEATANVIPAQNGPQFAGLDTIYLELGAAVSYKNGVTATDAQDGQLSYSVDPGDFNSQIPGRYTVFYSATDSDGNALIVPRTIVVESHIGQIVREKAQAILNQIIKPDMTRDQQIYAIFRRVKYYTVYAFSSDKSSIENAAYEGFTKGTGDCYTYYAMVRVMLDMLEIPNVEVRRVGGKSNHWWNLVQFEDGKYYHIDAIPHQITNMDHFKMTESVIEAYTNDPAIMKRRPNYYVYDHTLPEYQNIEIAQ